MKRDIHLNIDVSAHASRADEDHLESANEYVGDVQGGENFVHEEAGFTDEVGIGSSCPFHVWRNYVVVT